MTEKAEVFNRYQLLFAPRIVAETSKTSRPTPRRSVHERDYRHLGEDTLEQFAQFLLINNSHPHLAIRIGLTAELWFIHRCKHRQLSIIRGVD
jgi:hypothetical protein